MNAAIAKARASLPQFWEVFGNAGHGEKDFSLKVKITDKHGSEHFWLTDIERKDGQLHGIVNNDPDIVKDVKLASSLRFRKRIYRIGCICGTERWWGIIRYGSYSRACRRMR